MKLEHSLTSCTKTSPKWINDLSVRPDTIKALEEHVGRTLFDINHSKIFFDLSPKVMKRKTKINRTLLNLKPLHSNRNHKQDEKTTLRIGENIFQ